MFIFFYFFFQSKVGVYAIHFKTIYVMEFSRGKRILNLVSSTSGNNVKKAKKEIKNAELLLNYCCNKPSTTSDNTNLINEDDTQYKENNNVIRQ